MKNSKEWVADIQEKLNTRYAKRRKKRIFFSSSITLAAILIVAGITVYPKLVQSNQPSTSQNGGLADIYPNITYNQIHYNISFNVHGDNPNEFVGDYLGTITDYFVHKGPGTAPLETDKLYGVVGLSPNFVICAKTSKGWELFQKDHCNTGAELYGAAGLNLLNQYESVTYHLDDVDSNPVYNQPHKPLKLSKSDLEEFIHFLCTQPFMEPLSGPDELLYSIEFKLKNGTTATFNFMDNKDTGFIECGSCYTKLNDSLKQKLDSACK